MAKERNQQGDQDRAYPPDNLPNPTMNTSLTDPGPPPAEASGPSTSTGTGGKAGSSGTRQGAQSASQTSTPSAHPMSSTRSGAGAGNQGDAGLIPEIPWDPTGKIDDEVERRTLGSPKGGGQHPQAGAVGPGRYGGESDQPVSPNRYAGASDDAPTSPTAGATTTLASLTAEEADHEMRQGAGGGQSSDSETWQGGQATQEAMQAGNQFDNESAHRANTPDWQVSSGSNTPGEHPRVEQYGGGGGYGEVY